MNEKNEKCQQCRDYEFKQNTGAWPNGQAFNRWALYGCWCDTTPEKAAEFDHYWRTVTD